jgi:transposase-like protein
MRHHRILAAFGNSRNGTRPRTLRTAHGDATIQVPRDRPGTCESPLLTAYQTRTNEREDTSIGLDANGVSTRDIQDTVRDRYGVELAVDTISTMTDTIWHLVEAWQHRPLADISPIV